MFQRVLSILNSKAPDTFELLPDTSHMPGIFDSPNDVSGKSMLCSNLYFSRSFQSIPFEFLGSSTIKIKSAIKNNPDGFHLFEYSQVHCHKVFVPNHALPCHMNTVCKPNHNWECLVQHQCNHPSKRHFHVLH